MIFGWSIPLISCRNKFLIYDHIIFFLTLPDYTGFRRNVPCKSCKKVNGAKIGFSSYFLIEIRPGHVSVRCEFVIECIC